MSFEENLEYIKQHTDVKWTIDRGEYETSLEHLIELCVRDHKYGVFEKCYDGNCNNDCKNCTEEKEIIV